MILTLVLAVVFAVVAAGDSLYFHIWKYRLHNRVECAWEHLLHTANVCVFVPQIYLFFCVDAHGAWLVAAAALCAATLAIEVADVLSEHQSRRFIGGLTPVEYLLHFLMAGLRMGFVIAFFGGRSLDDFAGPAVLGEPLWYVRAVGLCLLAPGLVIAAVHLVLVVTGRRQRAALTPSRASTALG